MSEGERGVEISKIGEASSSAAEGPVPSAPDTEATDIGISNLSLEDKAKGPLTPTTPSTLEAPTGTESEQSSDHGGTDEVSGGATKTPDPIATTKERQVIAVSVSKGPSAFFNLARKFLVTDEECDLSALEGAIVSAVDAAHLLERSKIATIVRINTSYVTVEPKKRREYKPSNIGKKEDASGSPNTETGATSATTGSHLIPSQTTREPSSSLKQAADQIGTSRINQPESSRSSTTESSSSALPPMPQLVGKPTASKPSSGSLRRARIVITVKRTEAYEKWLGDNPITQGGQEDEHI